MKKELNVGLVGLGFIGKIHAIGYRDIALCFPEPQVTANLKAVLRTSLGRDQAFIKTAGIEMETTSIEEFFAQPLDLVDVCSPSAMHTQYVLEAARRGIPIYCEKPLGKDLADARIMAEAATQNNILTHIAFTQRYLPAIRQMKAALDSGKFGEVLNFRSNIFHSSYLDPRRPMAWRLRFAESGGGAFADLGAHLIDLVKYLIGDAAKVGAKMRTFIKERPVSRGSHQTETVDVDDWALCTLQLKNGAIGHIEATRMAAGISDEIKLQIFCRSGSLHFDAGNPNEIRIHDLKTGRWISGKLPYPDVSGERPITSTYPGAKYSQGRFQDTHMASCYDFLQCVQQNTPSQSDFQSALAVQEILEAAYRSAHTTEEMLNLPLKP
ncbi:MAG: Gfo/Idh/MocA family oxidoreductase [Anaerolineaceae bacterium]|nr:Gfo/Idh/MocA family oxidoreductase [Anaerolineaceae bacterium]